MNITSTNPCYIQFNGSTYSVSTMDPDTGEVETEDGLSEAQVDAMLKAVGMQVVGGQLVALDGFSLAENAPYVTVATVGGQQPLPDLTAPGASASTVASRAEAMEGCADGALAMFALMVMAEMSEQEMKTAKQIKAQMQDSREATAETQIGAELDKISAERDAAWQQMIGSFAGAVAGGLCGISGCNFLEGAGQQIGNLIGEGCNATFKSFGAQAKADELAVFSKALDAQMKRFDEVIELMGSEYEQAAEAFKGALRAIQDRQQQQTQDMSTILRG
jgi:hypothetical protein